MSNLNENQSILRYLEKGDSISPNSRIVVEGCVKKILPTDALINEDWHFEFRKDGIFAYSAYDCVDENGRHEEWLPFVIKIRSDLSFELGFRGSFSPRVEQARSYLREVIEKSFDKVQAELWATSLVKYNPKILAETLDRQFKLH